MNIYDQLFEFDDTGPKDPGLWIGNNHFSFLTNACGFESEPPDRKVWTQNYISHFLCLMEAKVVTIPERMPTDSGGNQIDHGIAVYWNDKLTRDEVNAVYKWLEANDPTHFCVSPDTAPIRIQRGDAPLDLEDVRERVALAMQATGLTDRLRELGIGPRS